jgi:hypothetical protein
MGKPVPAPRPEKAVEPLRGKRSDAITFRREITRASAPRVELVAQQPPPEMVRPPDAQLPGPRLRAVDDTTDRADARGAPSKAGQSPVSNAEPGKGRSLRPTPHSERNTPESGPTERLAQPVTATPGLVSHLRSQHAQREAPLPARVAGEPNSVTARGATARVPTPLVAERMVGSSHEHQDGTTHFGHATPAPAVQSTRPASRIGTPTQKQKSTDQPSPSQVASPTRHLQAPEPPPRHAVSRMAPPVKNERFDTERDAGSLAVPTRIVDRTAVRPAEPPRSSREAPQPSHLVLIPPLATPLPPTQRPAPATPAAPLKSSLLARGIDTPTKELKGSQQKAPTLLELAAKQTETTVGHPRRGVASTASPKKSEEPESSRDDQFHPVAKLTTPPPATAEFVTSAQAIGGQVHRTPESSTVAPPNPLPQVAAAHLEDPSLRVVVMPNIARLNVETNDGGSLALEVRVHDGVTDVRASGTGAMVAEAQQGALRLALAHEGLTLGQFTLAQSDADSSKHQRPEPLEEEATATMNRPAVLTQQTITTLRADGRLSVKA